VFEGSRATVNAEDEIRMTTRFDIAASEVFFAKAVLLVEGPGDRISCLRAFHLHELDVDRAGISITCCGGKTAIPFMAGILTSLQVPTLVFCDRDPNQPTEEQSDAIKGIVGNENFFELPDKLETALGLERRLNPIELIEFFNQFNSFNDMPEVFRGKINQVIDRLLPMLGI
jgi:predicted ATP-dependent endonuclease of OLD family